MLSACCLITLYSKCRLVMGGLLQVSLKALILALYNWRPLLLLLVPAACWFYQSSLPNVFWELKFAGKELQKNHFGRRDQEMRGIEIVVLALLTERRLCLVRSWKLWISGPLMMTGKMWEKMEVNVLVTKAVTFWLESLLVSGTGAFELSQGLLFKKLLRCLWDDLEGRTSWF